MAEALEAFGKLDGSAQGAIVLIVVLVILGVIAIASIITDKNK